MVKILIVDDSAFARTNLKRTLTGAGYDVVEASSGQQAIDQVKLDSPDIVTLDLLMPGLSGLDTLKIMKTIIPKTKFIIITADVQSLTREELIREGADAFINKPVSNTVLIETVKKLT
jgi:two-component system, chemotaxis family, chemotaxis protein CheY